MEGMTINASEINQESDSADESIDREVEAFLQV